MTDLVYRRIGRGRPLLFLHGSTLDHRMWHPQEVLADRFEVVSCDLRGFGRSPTPGGQFRHCDDVAALIDSLELGNVCVVGHSIGAHHALELALLRPDVVTGLVSVCMSGLSQDYPADELAMFAELKRLARTEGVDAAKRVWARSAWFTQARAHPMLAALLDDYLADYSGWYWLHDTPATKLDPPARAQLEFLEIPTLVIDGELDLDYNHRIASELVARIPEAALLRLPEVGHMASLEAPKIVTSAIRQFANLD